MLAPIDDEHCTLSTPTSPQLAVEQPLTHWHPKRPEGRSS
jgi:hypothetical protein